MLKELEAFFRARSHRRIGTGEYTDSMIWDSWTGLSQRLIPVFASQSQAVLELKTKTTQIDALRNLDHKRRTIMAWSLNTPVVIHRNEQGTASLKARIEAARQCQQWGYPLAFHIDPIVDYSGAMDDYRKMVDFLFDRIAAESIVWISLGSLRFMPDLKPTIQSRWPLSTIPYGEMITGLDGKFRYLKHIRIAIYQSIVEAIRKRSKDVTLYFCMENEEVWERVFGYTPERFGGLPHLLDKSAIEKCQLDP
jgi:spore photoproduct lyase